MAITIKKPTVLKYYLLSTLLCCAACVQHNNLTPAKTDTAVAKIMDTAKNASPNNTEFNSLVNQTNKAFEKYYSIPPSYTHYAIGQFHITKEEMKEILSQDEDETSTADSISGLQLSDYLRNKADEALSNVLGYKNIVHYKPTTDLFKHNVIVTSSADGKVYNFKYSAQSGGTYDSQVSMMQYRPGDGTVYNSFNDGIKSKQKKYANDFYSDGYDTIYVVNTADGVKYLLKGYVRISSYRYGQYIQLVKFNKNKVETNFSYLSTSEGDHIIYDDKLKTISVHYQTDDLNKQCSCELNTTNAITEPNDATGEEESAGGHKCKCRFVFNGKTFVLK